jgi:hypothetical protein
MKGRTVPQVRGVPPMERNGRRLLFSAVEFAELVDKPVDWVLRALELHRLSFFPHAFKNGNNEWMIPIGDVKAYFGGDFEPMLSMPNMARALDVDYEHFRKKVQSGKVASVPLKDLGEEPMIRIPASVYWQLRGQKPPRLSFLQGGRIA